MNKATRKKQLSYVRLWKLIKQPNLLNTIISIQLMALARKGLSIPKAAKVIPLSKYQEQIKYSEEGNVRTIAIALALKKLYEMFSYVI